MTDSTNNKTSILVNSQVPEFVRNEHDTFVKFLEYYYKSLEQDGEQIYVSKNLINFLNVDLINKDIQNDKIFGDEHSLRESNDYHNFLQKMYDNFITFIPDTIKADRVNILKHAKEFYTSRGSEKSIRFLMRALYGKEVEFYYPKQDILRVSDGKWFIERSLKVKNIAVNNTANDIAVTYFANHKIYGKVSKASAIVERVDTYFDKGQLVYELKLSNIYKQFLNDEQIYTYYIEEGNERYLTANLFSGVITSVTLKNGGSGYIEGASVPITSNGTGAQIVISRVTKGIIQGIGVTFGGAGFRVNDSVVISALSGSGASANVSNVNYSGYYHPNSYNVIWSTISLEAGTAIGNSVYSNLNSKIVNPANDAAGFINSMGTFAYSNCGPARSCFVINTGNNYVPPLSLSISANSTISKMGILGRLEIVDGGRNYKANDKINFINSPGSTGFGALANVAAVDANGTITQVRFIAVPGQIIGGSGYDWLNKPRANVISGTGNGANIMVTALIGHDEQLVASNSTIGTIQQLTIISGGSGYVDDPVLRLDQLGDGTANADLTVVSGAYSYSGRWVNDDGHLSSYNFLEDRDYYQNFSYVVKIDETINKYRNSLKSLIHPAGTKLFGEYLILDDKQSETNANIAVTYTKTESNTKFFDSYFQVQGFVNGIFAPNIVNGNASADVIKATYEYDLANTNLSATYAATGNNIVIVCPDHRYTKNKYVYLQFTSNASANIVNANYLITYANSDYIYVTNPYTVVSNVGNVKIFNPEVRISIAYDRPSVNDNVYLTFSTSDTKLVTGLYHVYSVVPGVFSILHPLANAATDSSNTVTIRSHKIVVTANYHNYLTNDLAYIRFTSGDTANTVNTYYTVTGVKDSNTFNILRSNLIMSSCNVSVYQRKSDIVITNHAAANANVVYVTFTSGDQANTTNGVYMPTVVGSDKFTINVANPATSNANVRIWYAQNNYSNIMFTRKSHGFKANDNVWIEFFTSSSDLANGIFKVNTVFGGVNSNTYNIYYNSNTYINTTSNTIVYSGLGVKTKSQMEGAASVGLYK